MAIVDFEKSNHPAPWSAEPEIFKFEREDWTAFRTVEGLQRKAGVAAAKLVRLVIKELTDNGLDLDAAVRVGHVADGNGYFVEDDGPGIDGTPADIARLFSINRPMVSTKLLRLPTRGALGNGLRVVAGAVLASGGSLVVITHNRRIVLRPERDGTTTVVNVAAVEHPVGTRVEITFGPALAPDDAALLWARRAIRMASNGRTYTGRSSPHWYDPANFHELLSASGDRPVRGLIEHLDGCTGATAGEIVAAAGLGRMVCKDVDAQQAAELLAAARSHARPVNPKRLGGAGADAFSHAAYAVVTGVASFGAGQPQAEIPFVVEAWALASLGTTTLIAFVNRTSITGEIEAVRNQRKVCIFGCGLSHNVTEAPKEAQFDLALNTIAPFVPITSDGKEPNLRPFLAEICDAIGKVVRKARRPNAKGITQKDVVLDHLDEAIAKVSDGELRFNQRQLLYVLRPVVMAALGQELTRGNFGKIITDFENEHGEIPLMYREPRGTIYHPHRNETLTLGTLMVEEYERPAWTYNKLIYCEKEGFIEALKAVRFFERHDCAPASSKGYTTRAVRDLVDKLAEHDEPVTVYCAVDADGYGTMILQTFQQATKARKARKIKIVPLGLDPWEAVEMGLEIETVEQGNARVPVADYVHGRTDFSPTGETWEQWLQTHRVELNAMTTRAFIDWLDQKLTQHGVGKLIPPSDVLEAELALKIESNIRTTTAERILREANFDQQVADAIAAIKMPEAAKLEAKIKSLFKQRSDAEWRDGVEAVARRLSK